MCIVPLFMHTTYAIQVDPGFLPEAGLEFDPGARLYCARGWRDRHGRFYDAEQLDSRVRHPLGPLSLRILQIENAREIDPRCYARFVAVFEKPATGEAERPTAAGIGAGRG